MKTTRFAITLAAGAALLALGFHADRALAQAVDVSKYPTRPIRLIIPFPPGGSNDILGRFIAQKMTERLGQTTNADNRPGADGIIGTDVVARAAPDGLTILIVSTSYTMNPAIHKLPYDPLKSLVPVSLIAGGGNVIAVHPNLPVNSIKELIALAKKNPGVLNYGSSGTGGNNHFAGGLFSSAAGIKMQHVPYKGISLAVTAIASGEMDILIASSSALLPQRDSGRIRILGVTSKEKSPMFPDLPPIAPQGAPGFEYYLWWGVFAPAGLPAERLAFITAAIDKIVASGDMKKFLDVQGAEPWTLPAAKLATLLPDEIARYRKAAKIAGIKPQ